MSEAAGHVVPIAVYNQAYQKLLEYEETIFNLRASIATVEAEVKYDAEKSIKNVLTESNFKVRVEAATICVIQC